jgi:RNA polymerase sigma-70 factor (ECF subfamily)
MHLVLGPTDRELVARVLVDDDRHAFSTLVRRHQAPLRAFALRLCGGDRGHADDVAQTAFILAWHHLRTFRGEGELRSWLLKLCYRAFLTDARRAHKKRETAGDDVPDAGHDAVDVGPRRDVLRAMATLKDEERAALALCFQEGLTHEEAAAVLEMPIGTLKSHVARGKEKLRGLLAAYRPPDDTPPHDTEAA